MFTMPSATVPRHNVSAYKPAFRDFLPQLIEEMPEKFCPAMSFLASGSRLHGSFESEQFAEDVVESVKGIVWCAEIAEGIFWLIERPSQLAAKHQRPRQADSAQGVQPVGILQDLGFGSEGRDSSSEAMGLDRMGNFVQLSVGPADFF